MAHTESQTVHAAAVDRLRSLYNFVADGGTPPTIDGTFTRELDEAIGLLGNQANWYARLAQTEADAVTRIAAAHRQTGLRDERLRAIQHTAAYAVTLGEINEADSLAHAQHLARQLLRVVVELTIIAGNPFP